MPIKLIAKFCSVAALVLLVIFALGPANWRPRTGLGWQFDHFFDIFAVTLLVCFAWPCIGRASPHGYFGASGGSAGFHIDRSANLLAALCGASGRWCGLLAELFIPSAEAARRLGRVDGY